MSFFIPFSNVKRLKGIELLWAICWNVVISFLSICMGHCYPKGMCHPALGHSELVHSGRGEWEGLKTKGQAWPEWGSVKQGLTRRKTCPQRRGGDPLGAPHHMWLWFKMFSNMSIYSNGKEGLMPIPFPHWPRLEDLGRAPHSQRSAWHLTCSRAGFVPLPPLPAQYF